jgi:aspartyl/asparaginyl-tRNA synthetase
MDIKIRDHFYEFLFDNRQLTLKNNKNYSIIKIESMSKDKHHDFQEEQFYLINPMSVDNRGKVIFLDYMTNR